MKIEKTLTDSLRLSFVTGAPILEHETLPEPEFHDGCAECAGLELQRCIRELPGGFAISMRLRNLRREPVRVRRISLLRFTAGELAGAGAFPQWNVFRNARQKNDIPGFFMPAVVNEDMEDALFDSSEAVAGAGISWEDFSKGLQNLPCRFTSDPGMILFPGMGAEPVFVGFVGQDLHLNEVNLETVPDRQELKCLEALAAFDGAQLLPGAEFATHELIVRAGASLAELLNWHTEAVAELYKVPPPPAAKPVVFCSWYFYGKDIREEDVVENLAALEKNPVPFDVIQIDHGWMDIFGDWRANEDFPGGLDHLAGIIRAAGYTPGIWTAPFVLHPDSETLRRQPELTLRNSAGEPCIFKCEAGDCHVLDPYSPYAEAYLTELFQRLKKHGFLYHKLDFVRAIILNEDVRYADSAKNRAQAYRHGVGLIRKALGTDAYFEVCGGLYEGSAGLADAVRSSCDVRGHWDGTPTRIYGYPVRIKQNVYRSHYNRFWHTDPDALQLRRRNEPFRGYQKGLHLAMGTFTDEEAFSTVVNQFLGGGLVCMAERLADFDADRRALYRCVVPQYAPPALPVPTEFRKPCPEIFITDFKAPANRLPPWRIITAANWEDNEKKLELCLSDCCDPALPGSARIAVFEFYEQRFFGILPLSEVITVTVPAHGCRLLRLTPLPIRAEPALIGTDLNLSQGLELSRFSGTGDNVEAALESPWDCEVTLTVLIPGSLEPRKIMIGK